MSSDTEYGKLKKQFRRQVLFLAVTFVVGLSAFVPATYAWFTAQPYANVEPMTGSTTSKYLNLLISQSQTGPFSTECGLSYAGSFQNFMPVSTANLTNYYHGLSQNRDGITLTYEDVTSKYEQYVMHGTVYLKSENRPCSLYFDKDKFIIRADGQAAAAMRLGFKISGSAGSQTYVFNVDEIAGASGGESKQTTEQTGVISGINGEKGVFTSDPAISASQFYAGSDGEDPTKGQRSLIEMSRDEVVTVEYFLYMEGCDTNCLTSAQAKDVTLQLGFAGVTPEQ